ncbi:uncharacterized protein LAESUDRAFT_731301, partial [Laetiporus sulphureus 93-53]
TKISTSSLQLLKVPTFKFLHVLGYPSSSLPQSPYFIYIALYCITYLQVPTFQSLRTAIAIL